MKKRRIEVLNEIEDLKRFLCKRCRGLKGNEANKVENIFCGCYAAARMRELGDELLELVDERYQVKLLKDIKNRGYITVSELVNLNLNYGVTHVEVVEAMNFSRAGFDAVKVRLGLLGLNKMSEQQIANLVERYKHIRINHRYLRESMDLRNAVTRRYRHERKTSKSKAKAMA